MLLPFGWLGHIFGGMQNVYFQRLKRICEMCCLCIRKIGSRGLRKFLITLYKHFVDLHDVRSLRMITFQVNFLGIKCKMLLYIYSQRFWLFFKNRFLCCRCTTKHFNYCYYCVYHFSITCYRYGIIANLKRESMPQKLTLGKYWS